MMQKRLRFLLLLVAAAVLVFSCAGGPDAASDSDESLPEVEAVVADGADSSASGSAVQAVSEEVAPVSGTAFECVPDMDGQQNDADNEDVTSQEASPVQDVEDALSWQEEEAVPADDSVLSEDEETTVVQADSADLSPEYYEDEFIPVEDEVEYVLDVSSYYDDFSISDDDFVAIIPAVQPEEPAEIEDISLELTAVTDGSADSEEPVYEREVPETAAEPPFETLAMEIVPVMEPVPVPPAREDMKKPVVLVTEDEAARVNEQEKEIALAELENILAEIPEPEEPAKPVASRSVVIHKNDILEIPYQGNWWVYLGDANNSGALVFSGRDYISEKTVFTLRAVKEGESLLHFFKQDIIGGVMVDDYLEVVVEEASDASDKIELDMFIISQIKPVPAESDESAPAEDVSFETDEPVGNASTSELQKSSAVSSVPAPSASGKTDASNDVTYIQLFEEPSVTSGAADSASEPYSVETEESPLPGGSAAVMNAKLTDAELFAKAQELEETDIEGALEVYKKLVAEYPASTYWNQANKRITYINRFYFFKR